MAANADFPELTHRSASEIATFWLSDAGARLILNEQLAELLRTILDARAAASETIPKYCPACAESLAEFEQPDVWVRGMRCPGGHAWAFRGGRLSNIGEPHSLTLHAELTMPVAKQLVRSWLEPNPYLAPQLHVSVAQVFKWWLNDAA